MQCARCSRVLPANEHACPFCGLAVVPADGSATAADGADFVFQEYAAPASEPEPVTGGPAPFSGPPVTSFGAAPRPLPPAGQPGYPPPGVPLMYAPIAPVAPAPKKHRGLATGWIILYVFLGLAVLFTGVGIGIYQLGSAVGASSNATQTAAMQLYQQVTSKSPTLQDPLTDPTTNSWASFDKGTYGCAPGTNGLRAYIDETNRFIYCTYTAVNIASLAFQVQMQILSGDAGGFVFRVMPTANDTSLSLYCFRVDSSGNYELFLDKDTSAGKVSNLVTGVTRAVDTQSQSNTLTLIIKGSVFDIYINQQFVTQVHDSTLAYGQVGLLAGEGTRSTSVLYTNAKFWYLGN